MTVRRIFIFSFLVFFLSTISFVPALAQTDSRYEDGLDVAKCSGALLTLSEITLKLNAGQNAADQFSGRARGYSFTAIMMLSDQMGDKAREFVDDQAQMEKSRLLAFSDIAERQKKSLITPELDQKMTSCQKKWDKFVSDTVQAFRKDYYTRQK